jgi:glycosyltransferase involved in cell wall biosynthesis
MSSQTSCLSVLMMARELNFGGIERDVSKLARHLSKFGISPHVACFRPGGVRWREIEDAGIPVLAMPLTSFASTDVFSCARKMRRYLTDHDIHVVHTFDDSTNTFGIPMARLFGVQATLSSQLCYRELSPLPARMVMAVLDRIATGVYVNCFAISRYLTETWKILPSQIHVCHNGFEPDEFNPINRQRPPHLDDASLIIGTVALLREEKNIPILIEAFAQVHKVDPRAHLLIVGSGPLRPLLQQRIEEHRIAAVCTLVEATATPADWMRAIDVFVLPSLSEGFSNSLLEAMACGCCPVASNVGGLPEMITHGESGFLVEPGNLQQLADALCVLALNAKRRQQMAEAAVRFVQEHLTIDVAASRLARIYRGLLNPDRTAR